MAPYCSIEWRDGAVRILDQRRLPHESVYRDFSDYRDLAVAIRDMVIRGAPAIGVAAAYGLALASYGTKSASVGDVYAELKAAADALHPNVLATCLNLRLLAVEFHLFLEHFSTPHFVGKRFVL